MSLLLKCTHCQTAIKVPDSARGKGVRCPKCQGIVMVPDGAGPASGTITERRPAAKSVKRMTPAPQRLTDPQQNLMRRPAGDKDKRRSRWPLITGVVAAVLGLVVGGFFVFRPAKKAPQEVAAANVNPAEDKKGEDRKVDAKLNPVSDKKADPGDPVPEPAPSKMSPGVLANVKKATVFVRVESKGVTVSGSGFVTQVEGDSALVVTNHHVIEPKLRIEVIPRSIIERTAARRPVRPGRPIRPGRPRPIIPRPHRGPFLYPNLTPRVIMLTLKDAHVTVVFDSGTKQERSATAQVLAADAEHDLAVLRVTGVKDLPTPIQLANGADLRETMPVYTFGFPFGKALATSKRHPAVTVGQATISSLRQDDDGELALVQIDGSLNPGNSGGPVVNTRGQVVGIAVATIRDSSGIGLAIPGDELRKILNGRLGTPLVSGKVLAGKLNVTVELAVIDPTHKISSVALYCIPSSQVKDPGAVKSLEDLPGVNKVDLAIDKQLASGQTTFITAGGATELLVQAVLVRGDGGKTTDKISRQALKDAPAVAVTPPPPPAPKSQPGAEVPGAPPLPPAPAGQPGKTVVDLIPLLDTARDPVHGRWLVVKNALHCNEMHFVPRIQIPYIPPQEYDVTIVFWQPKLRNGVGLIMPNPKGGSFVCSIGQSSGANCSVLTTKGWAHQPLRNRVTTDKPHTWTVQVRRDSVTCLFDGETVLSRKTDFADLGSDAWHRIKDTRLLAVACDDPAVHYHVRLTEITGTGKKTR